MPYDVIHGRRRLKSLLQFFHSYQQQHGTSKVIYSYIIIIIINFLLVTNTSNLTEHWKDVFDWNVILYWVAEDLKCNMIIHQNINLFFWNNNYLSSAFKVKVNENQMVGGNYDLYISSISSSSTIFEPHPLPLSNFFRKKIISDQTRRRAYQNSFFPITHSTLYGPRPRMVGWIFSQIYILFELFSLPIKSSKILQLQILTFLSFSQSFSLFLLE